MPLPRPFSFLFPPFIVHFRVFPFFLSFIIYPASSSVRATSVHALYTFVDPRKKVETRKRNQWRIWEDLIFFFRVFLFQIYVYCRLHCIQYNISIRGIIDFSIK